MRRLSISIIIPWVITGSIMGSLIAIIIGAVKVNPWLILYLSFVFGWLLVLTAVMVENFKTKQG